MVVTKTTYTTSISGWILKGLCHIHDVRTSKHCHHHHHQINAYCLDRTGRTCKHNFIGESELTSSRQDSHNIKQATSTLGRAKSSPSAAHYPSPCQFINFTAIITRVHLTKLKTLALEGSSIDRSVSTTKNNNKNTHRTKKRASTQ